MRIPAWAKLIISYFVLGSLFDPGSGVINCQIKTDFNLLLTGEKEGAWPKRGEFHVNWDFSGISAPPDDVRPARRRHD